ncbi:MAG TPA: response regulator transcription factor [Fibrobacteria bacterium]|nr:response regulator transcription factor [Fibrobacteria bacterium]HOX53249.1 response regulator transcription factor [Fibrobacteria bacterium]
MPEARILVVEDDASIRSGLRVTLELEGFSVEEACDGQEAMKILPVFLPDIVLLDLMLPGKSGFDICRELRSQRAELPILMLTARSDEASKVAGLTLGADDYVTKPFSLAELIARIRNLLRRKAMRAPAAVEVVEWQGRIRIDFKQFRCWVEGQPIDLSTREFEILRDFATHPGEVVRREDLLERVWGYSPDNLPSTRTVDNFLMRLRQKLEVDQTNPQLLTSVRGAGYRLEIGPAT